MELNPAFPLEMLDTEILMRLGAAAVLGLIVGFDREWRGHAAGMRTHGLVCVAAAGMAVSVMALYNQLDAPRVDPLRMFEAAAGFIGIVGAGLIVFSRGKVHNLTTAAHLWLATVIGLACGLGQWPLVLVLAIISLVIITIMRFVEGWLGQRERKLDGD
ncbi:MgtC/SapB family protein [Citromicrobium bathyomarinum]|uniref:MgtC/SapB family protein n=1 Tax=Citromicrobium bathyomarinum TaxID=72174 RepID=UPI00315B1794